MTALLLGPGPLGGVQQEGWSRASFLLHISHLVKHIDDSRVFLRKASRLVPLLQRNWLNVEYLAVTLEHPAVHTTQALVKSEDGG